MSRPTRAPVRRAALLTLILATGPLHLGAVHAQPSGSSGPATAAPSLEKDKLTTAAPKGYLSEEATPNLAAILPPPPAGHSAAEAADRAIYNATRAYQGTARWALATNDVADGGAALLEDYACVLGQRIDQTRVPDLMRLLDRARIDVARATRVAKRRYRRLRPFVGNEAPICVARSPELADSFSYPSGHAGQGWAYGMIMASLMPEKATQFLVRSRLYGESRVVCGVHWLSDVEAARTGASALMSVLLADAGFRADLERARADLKRVLGGEGMKPDPTICAREDAAARQPLL
ncbi:MAG TPA: phosphatase PAP2 family protein [Methylobacterium sp.]|jgi:acid phosphatase (class A)|uniref:acid phosphatase n=1 Tax=Methylorubrum sp. B1-46 TaxID=2897334 RepID=UPI001E642997|nr:phosphatase PAP2 family protein [Methylorubrum sp. B1-46]UGB27692.1 phosphatase PAP2 family protein [Methylorubrum sp. B1-46]HEV2542655.1 phosphatase PAP2 family protein [Methylobacterium sp.]